MMTSEPGLGGSRLRRISAVVGTLAVALMVAVPITTHSLGVANADYVQPQPRVGSTATWEPPTTTTPPAAPVTEKAVPTVKAPHK